ncbi:MFS transporter [Mycolicibacterium chitae]|uniref:Major facilitator superfamily transporter n=1 Tax=Mycolicibacterium chitae TaxID=1792 RepID=A0A3S5EI92_MYCCI|nr:MFS transporter [Mycolicibacterium chitae]MCV7108707.1 MFS transporter [Mycolicibacterium chitae]BBZ03539.1 MFS transporter [Mycolicibacterium chitae]VEG47178.1 major facilitator superfamily transporter [Mycolicibacterium chitae]
MRRWIVWSVGLLAYIVAVLDRTTLGVSGLDAADRFNASPAILSTFVVLQIVVYAGAQIPAGLLLDRFGSRAMIVSGGLLMAAGQLTLAFSESLPTAIAARAVVGLGDAFTFISVLRLVPYWFSERQIPMVTQLTGICGQLGQVLSALPFLALLGAAGWSTAYLSAAAFGVLVVVLTIVVVRDTPRGRAQVVRSADLAETFGSLKTVWLRPGTRLGFFTHMGCQFSITVFALMWGIPYLTEAQGLSRGTAGALLTVSVAAAIAAGILIGIITARNPHRRSWLVLGIMASNAAIWAVVLALPGPAPLWLLVVLIIVISIGGPGSMVGFDHARTFNPSRTLGTATGIINMGGFIASLLVMQAMGMIIDAAGGYSFDAFRYAWAAQYVIWILAAVAILIARRKARRTIGDIDESKYLLEFFDDRRE